MLQGLFAWRKAEVVDPALIAQETQAHFLRLGYEYVYDRQGNNLVVLQDYPNRPLSDHMQVTYLTAPVGHVAPARTGKPASYLFQAPSISGLGTAEGADIRASLSRFEAHVTDFAVRNDLPVRLTRVAPLMHVLASDPERIRVALTNRVHPKWLGDMLALGLTFDEAIEMRSTPASLLFALYAERVPSR